MQTNSLGDATIFGDRVELRPVNPSDFELVYRWLNNPEIYRWWGGIPVDSDAVRQKYLGLRRPQVDGYIIGVTGIPIGYAQRHQTSDDEGSVDLFLVPEMRGRGYGGDTASGRSPSTSCRLMDGHGFWWIQSQTTFLPRTFGES